MHTRTGNRPLLAQVIAQTLLFPGSPENKQSVHASGNEVFDQTFQTGNVQRVVAFQRSDQGWDDTTKGTFQKVFHNVTI